MRPSAAGGGRVDSAPVSADWRALPIDGQFAVSFVDRSEAPIYAGLVEEQGDVPAEVRRVAEQTLREVDRALDFSAVRAPASFR